MEVAENLHRLDVDGGFLGDAVLLVACDEGEFVKAFRQLLQREFNFVVLPGLEKGKV